MHIPRRSVKLLNLLVIRRAFISTLITTGIGTTMICWKNTSSGLLIGAEMQIIRVLFISTAVRAVFLGLLKVEEHDCVLAKSGFLNVFDTDPCFLLCLFNIERIRKVVHTHNGEPHFFTLPYIFKKSGIYCLPVTLSENYKLDPAILNLPGIETISPLQILI